MQYIDYIINQIAVESKQIESVDASSIHYIINQIAVESKQKRGR